MRETKLRMECFAPFDFQGAEKHLSAMAAKGWQVELMDGVFWKYRRAEPARVHYAVTCPPDSGREDDRLFFEDLCETAGWKKVSDWAGMQVYASPAAFPTPLETDASLFLERIHRAMKGSYLNYHRGRVACAAILLLGRLTEFWLTPRSFFLSNLSIGLAAACLLLLLFHAGCAAGYRVWHRRSLRTAEESGTLLPVPGWCGVVSRASYFWFLSLFLPILLEAGFGSPQEAFRLFFMVFAALFAAGLAVFLAWALKRGDVGKDSQAALAVLAVVVVLLAFGRRQFNPADLFKAPELEPGEYVWNGMRWDEDPPAIPLTAEDLTGREWPHIRRRVYDRGYSLFGSETDYYEFARREDGEKCDIDYKIINVSNQFVYIRIRDSLLQTREDDAYQAGDPAPWEALAVYTRNWGGSAYGEYLICWPGRIVQLYVNDFTLSGEQIAAAAERLAPKEAVS